MDMEYKSYIMELNMKGIEDKTNFMEEGDLFNLKVNVMRENLFKAKCQGQEDIYEIMILFMMENLF